MHLFGYSSLVKIHLARNAPYNKVFTAGFNMQELLISDTHLTLTTVVDPHGVNADPDPAF
jgi:hypothetical protein